MAEIIDLLGRGGQRFEERVLKWNRQKIRKGQRELQAGEPIQTVLHEFRLRQVLGQKILDWL